MSKATAHKRARGRPRQLSPAEREALILDAAERLLVKNGFDAATMEGIAAEAGMSKRTLYEVFRDRAALVEACVRRIRLSLVRPLSREERALPLRRRLLRMFEPDARNVDLATPLAVLRAVIVEAQRRPEIGRAFLREGPETAYAEVAEELRRAVAAGEILLKDPDLAARMLCDMVFDNPIERLIDRTRAPRSAEEAETRLTLAVETFLAGCKVRPGPRSI